MAVQPVPEQAPGAIQVISRAARLLRALDGEPDGLSLAQLAERIELPRSSVHRLVTAMEVEGLVTGATTGGGIRLGTEILRLGERGRRDLQRELRPVMEALFDNLNETVDLAVLEGDHLRFIDQIPAPHRLRAVSAIGDVFPLHCTANGKAVLALVGDVEARRLLPSRLTRFTDRTITRRPDLATELARVTETGLATDREEHTDGICAMGFAVRDLGGTVAAISVPTPTQRFQAQRQAIERELAGARRAALRVLGG